MSSPSLLVGELCDEARLTHSTIATQQYLEQVVVITIHVRAYYLTIMDTSTVNFYFD